MQAEDQLPLPDQIQVTIYTPFFNSRQAVLELLRVLLLLLLLHQDFTFC